MGRPYNKPRLFEDRISKLPDDILHQILSHLTTKFTVKTSILSKRWRYLWTSTRFLHFDRREFSSTSIDKFICFVDRVLSLRDDNSIIENFTLLWRDDFDMHKAKEWLSYALRYNVKEVILDIIPVEESSLSSDLLLCQSLQVLRLTSFGLVFPTGYYFRRISTNLSKLKTLHIHTTGPCEGITELISKCPVLENLSLCTAFCDFKISAPNLKELVLRCHHGAPNLRIFVPMLVRLDVYCIFDRIPELLFECKLENLADASIFCNGGIHGSGRKLLEILRCLQNAKSLSLRGNVVELLHEVSQKPLPSFCNLRRLSMKMPIKVVGIQVMIMLLQNCPNLENFVIEIPKKEILHPESTKAGYDQISWESCYACSLNHLKEVEIVGFHFGDEDEVGLVNFLLHRSCSLRRLKISYEEKFPDYEICTKTIKKLKSLALSLGTTIKFTSCTRRLTLFGVD